MRKTKKALTLFMALAVICSSLIGCQSQSNSGSSDGSNSKALESLSSTGSELEQETLNYWIVGPGKQKDSDKVWAQFNKEIQEKLPNTSVDFTVITGAEYATKWAAAMAAQEPVDLAWTGWMLSIPDEANKGSLMPLSDLLEKYGQDVISSLGQKVIDIHRISDGEIYQIPVWQGLVGNRTAFRFPEEVVTLVGENYTQELQQLCYDTWDTPTVEARSKVYDKIEEYLKAAKDGGKLAKGYPAGNGDITNYLLTGTALDKYTYVEYNDDTFTVKSRKESDLYKMYYQYMADWFQKGYIRSDIASVETVNNTWDTDKTWESSYILSLHNGFTDTTAQEESARYGFGIKVSYTRPDCEYVLGTATGTSIPTSSRYPERAMMLINLLCSDGGVDAYHTFVYGIKGENYTENTDGTITTLGGNGQATADWPYGGWKWTMGTCMNALTTQADTAGYYQELKKKEATAYVNPLLTFTFDNTNVQTEQAQIDAVVEEYDAMLSRGYLGDGWESKYEEFTSKLKAAGMDAYVAEMQKQVTEFVTKNNSKW